MVPDPLKQEIFQSLGDLPRGNSGLGDIEPASHAPRSIQGPGIDPEVLVDDRHRHAGQLPLHLVFIARGFDSHVDVGIGHVTLLLVLSQQGSDSAKRPDQVHVPKVHDPVQAPGCHIDNGRVHLSPLVIPQRGEYRHLGIVKRRLESIRVQESSRIEHAISRAHCHTGSELLIHLRTCHTFLVVEV